ncbi:MAG: hypothetical protein JRD39_00995 [Deltaproteobacteria bacterium]|nr:hypothetical protein [Deltaproteobacteria bacterium]
MKQDIFSRYESFSDSCLAIDVSVGKIAELFEDFDSAASYIKKDLDQDFVDYLIESVQEIGRNDFVIRINLPEHVQEKHRERVRKSMKSYFQYLELLEWRKLRKMLSKSLLLFGLGMFLLTVSIILQGHTELLSDMMQDLIIEGLTVAAWVSLWSSFAILIFEFTGTIADIRIYRRIAGREVIFKSRDSAAMVPADSAG